MVVYFDERQIKKIKELQGSNLIKINLEKQKIVFTFADRKQIVTGKFTSDRLSWIMRQKGYETEFIEFIFELIVKLLKAIN